MTAINIDKELREKLQGSCHDVRLCDETGSTLGWFVPEAEYMKMLYERARYMFTNEELEVARRAQPVYTTAEVIEYLNKL